MAFGYRVDFNGVAHISDSRLVNMAQNVTGQRVPSYGSLTTKVTRKGDLARVRLIPQVNR